MRGDGKLHPLLRSGQTVSSDSSAEKANIDKETKKVPHCTSIILTAPPNHTLPHIFGLKLKTNFT